MNSPLHLHRFPIVLAVLSIFILQSPAVFAQGPLTPPGAPVPTMKSLDQIQPRTPISSAYTIFAPGSYYLTTNISVVSGAAITIATSGVTLDLNGFSLISTAPSPSGYGVFILSNLRNITIANGFIQGGVTNNGSGVYSGGGFVGGIYYATVQPANILVSHVSISGCGSYGIYLLYGDSSIVDSCIVRTCGGYGIYASVVRNSWASDCGNTAIFGDQVSDCHGQCSGSGYGVGAGSLVQNCYGTSNSGDGVNSYMGLNCFGNSNGGGSGVYCTSAAQNCYGHSTSGNGVYAAIAQNCSGNSGSSYGINAYFAAQNCYGFSGGNPGPGLYAYTASFCAGNCSVRAINAIVANGCIAYAGTNLIGSKYNMP